MIFSLSIPILKVHSVRTVETRSDGTPCSLNEVALIVPSCDARLSRVKGKYAVICLFFL